MRRRWNCELPSLKGNFLWGTLSNALRNRDILCHSWVCCRVRKTRFYDMILRAKIWLNMCSFRTFQRVYTTSNQSLDPSLDFTLNWGVFVKVSLNRKRKFGRKRMTIPLLKNGVLWEAVFFRWEKKNEFVDMDQTANRWGHYLVL